MKVPSWPSGHVSFDGEILEFGAGELSRVPVANVKSIEVKGPKLGRLNLKLNYQAGLNNVKTGAWIEQEHQQALDELVAAVQSAIEG